MLWFIIGLVVGVGAGLGTMYFGTKKGLVAKVEAKVNTMRMALVVIEEDVKKLKNVKVDDMDDALKAIGDKIEEMF